MQLQRQFYNLKSSQVALDLKFGRLIILFHMYIGGHLGQRGDVKARPRECGQLLLQKSCVLVCTVTDIDFVAMSMATRHAPMKTSTHVMSQFKEPICSV